MGCPACSPAGPTDRATAARASTPEARRPPDQRRGPSPTDAAGYPPVVVPSGESRAPHRPTLPRPPSTARRTGRSPHPGRALSVPEIRRGSRRRCLCGRPGDGSARIPLCPSLSGAEAAIAAQLTSSRPSLPATHAVPRPYPKPNPGETRMNLIELQRALRQLRLGGMAAVLETRLRQAQAEAMAPIDLISCLVSDELMRRSERLLERRRKQAAFRDLQKTLDNFDFTFNPKINRSLVFDLATGAFIAKREDALFLGPGGTGKSHLAQAIGQAAIQQGYRVWYRETHVLLDELADAIVDGTRKEYLQSLATVPC